MCLERSKNTFLNYQHRLSSAVDDLTISSKDPMPEVESAFPGENNLNYPNLVDVGGHGRIFKESSL